MDFIELISIAGYAIETIGVAVIIVDSMVSTFRFLSDFRKEPEGFAYGIFWRHLERSIILGLEFLIAGDIIRTVIVADTLTNVMILGLIILIRTFLSFTLHFEVEGRWPWGGQPNKPVMTEQRKRRYRGTSYCPQLPRNSGNCMTISIDDEFSKLQRVIIGLGSPYQTDKTQVASEMSEFPFVPNTDRKPEVLTLTFPTEETLLPEYADYVGVLESYGVEVLRADPAVAYSFDYTCPRDIGFVIGDHFFVANMAVQSRTDEIRTVQHLLTDIDPDKILRPPAGAMLEGGDVIMLDVSTILVGINQRSNHQGYAFLSKTLTALGYRVLPVEHSQLHLDCCLNPLGRGHLLIHPESLEGNGDEIWRTLERLSWVRIDAVEREYLATNVLSINPDTIIARNHVACARVNQAIRDIGYHVEEIGFDGVPATGGSFRCASLVLNRVAES